SKFYQYDKSKSNQILLKVDISQPQNDDYEVKSDELLSDLNVLISNKFVTSISKGFYTRFIDDEFGSRRIRKFFFVVVLRVIVLIHTHTHIYIYSNTCTHIKKLIYL